MSTLKLAEGSLEKSNLNSEKLSSWLKQYRNMGVSIDIRVDDFDSSLRVIEILEENDDEVVFLAKSSEADLYMINFSKLSPQSSKVVTLSSRMNVENLHGDATVEKCSLGKVSSMFPGFDVDLSQVKEKIAAVMINGRKYEVLKLLGSGRTGVVVEVFIDDPNDPENRGIRVLKINVTSQVEQDTAYEMLMSSVVAERVGWTGSVVIPDPNLVEVGVIASGEELPFKKGRAIGMRKVDLSSLGSWDKYSSNLDAVLTAYTQWAELVNLYHTFGIVNGDPHATNILAGEDGSIAAIDLDQFRFVDFSVDFIINLLKGNYGDQNISKEIQITLLGAVYQSFLIYSTEQDKSILSPELNASFEGTEDAFQQINSYARIYNEAVFYNNFNLGDAGIASAIEALEKIVTANTSYFEAHKYNELIATLIKNSVISLDWGKVIDVSPKLLIHPGSNIDAAFGIYHTRTANMAVPRGAILEKDIDALIASENRAIVVELMHALNFPFYLAEYSYSTGSVQNPIKPFEWNSNDNSSFGVQQIMQNHHYGTTAYLSSLATKAREDKSAQDFKNLDEALFVSQDFFVDSVRQDSKLVNLGLSDKKLRVLYNLFKTYMVEFDLVYTFELRNRGTLTFQSASHLIQAVIKLINSDGDSLIDTAEFARFFVDSTRPTSLSIAEKVDAGIPLTKEESALLGLTHFEA